MKLKLTFDEIVELYEKDPVSFLETILSRRRYEFPVGDECCACASWDKIIGAQPRHVTRDNHDRDGRLPQPHRFEPNIGFFLVEHLSEKQLRELVARYRRRLHGREDDNADLLDLYRREKFAGKSPQEPICGTR